MTAFRVFASTDAGAPALSGQAGSLTALLDAVLVDGYGTGPSAKAPAGWTRVYTATNKRVYRGDAIAGTGYYLRVDDTATVGNARHAWLRAFYTMSDIDTGSELVPTAAQAANGSLWQKSITADATARAWVIVANNKSCYFFNAPSGIAASEMSPFFFGDFVSHKPGDQHNFHLSFNGLTAYTGTTNEAHGTMFRGAAISSTIGSTWGIGPSGYNARGASGAVGPEVAGCVQNDAWVASGYGNCDIPYPDPVSGGFLWGPGHVRDSAVGRVRGKWPGLIVPLHNRALPDMTVLTDLEGGDGIDAYVKSFRGGSLITSTSAGQVLFDLTTEY